jgi:hypothetical protein
VPRPAAQIERARRIIREDDVSSVLSRAGGFSAGPMAQMIIPRSVAMVQCEETLIEADYFRATPCSIGE